MSALEKQIKRHKRHKRVRAKISGTIMVPRFCVTRTNTHIYAQLIDDNKGHTLLAASDLEVEKTMPNAKKSKKVAIASEVGKLIAKKAKEKKIERVAFDRGGYKYHGRVKALAEGAREAGLRF